MSDVDTITIRLGKPGYRIGKLTTVEHDWRSSRCVFRCDCGGSVTMSDTTLRDRVRQHGWDPGCETCSPFVKRQPTGLFGPSGEPGERLKAVLDAIDLTACEGEGGWIRLVTVEARRAGLEGEERTRSAADRWWSRTLARLRKHGIDYETYHHVEGAFTNTGGNYSGPKDGSQEWDHTAIRWTEDGEDRLLALVEALDKWLLSRDEGEE